MIYIYALTDPDGTPRYVGQSNNPRKRLTEHRCSGSPAVQEWLTGLAQLGVRPAIRVVEKRYDRSLASEHRWIARIASRFPLLNGVCRGLKADDPRLVGRRRTAEIRRTELRARRSA